MASEGVVYPGVRIESVPHEELAAGWAEDALKDSHVFAGLARALDKIHDGDIENVRLLSVGDVERLIASVPEICNRRKIGGLIWAVIRDERSEITCLARPFLDAFYRFLDKQEETLTEMDHFFTHLEKGRLNQKDTQKIKQILLNLMKENQAFKKAFADDKKLHEKLTRQLDELKRNLRIRESETTSLKNDLARLRRESDRKDQQISGFEQKLKSASTGKKNEMLRHLHDLERNERKLQHETTHLGNQLMQARDNIQAKDRLLQELQGNINQLNFKNEQLQKESQRLSASKNSVDIQPIPREKAVILPKERGRRLGVFVDIRSLWQASRLLQRKVDFEKLLDFIVLDRHLVKAVAYVLTAPESDYSRFIGMLEQKGFQVRVRPLTRFADGSIAGGWSAGLAADVIFLSGKMNLDIVHLVVGDADFSDLLKLVKSKSLRAEASGFAVNAASELSEAADDFLSLGDDVLRSPLPAEDQANS